MKAAGSRSCRATERRIRWWGWSCSSAISWASVAVAGIHQWRQALAIEFGYDREKQKQLYVMWISFPMYCTLHGLGFALALFLSPWFLTINVYIVPVLRFNYWASFSLLLADCTFGTKDGGLHMAGGPLLYLLLVPAIAIEFVSNLIHSKHR